MQIILLAFSGSIIASAVYFLWRVAQFPQISNIDATLIGATMTTAVFLCAYGIGDDCQPCFEGALCPGGYRAWSQPGYFSPSEPAGVVRCSPPSLDRCLNWTQGATLCGTGYLQGSPGCKACDDGFFLYADGAC